MIDTHCHLIHGVDDGSRNRIESLMLARELAAAGVTQVVCTPHWSRRFKPTPAAIATGLEQLRAALQEAELELELVLAAEVSTNLAMDASAAELSLRALGRHVIVELDPETTLTTLTSVMRHLGDIGLLPILAHPERCRAVQRDPALLDGARAEGALVQVVARSFRGFPDEVSETAWTLIGTGRADLLGSDAHRPRHVSTFRAVLGEVTLKHGDALARELVHTRPAAVLDYR